MVVGHEGDQRSVDYKDDIARRYEAAFNFAVATGMVSITRMRLASTTRSRQLAHVIARLDRLFFTRAIMLVIVSTCVIGMDTW